MNVPYIDYKNHPAYGSLYKKPSLALRIRALKRFLPEFFTQLKLYAIIALKKKRSRLSPLNNNLKDLYKKFKEDGVLAFKINDDDISEVKKIVEPFIKALEEHKASVPSEKRKFEADKLVRIPTNTGLLEKIEKILKNNGVIEMASHNKKWPLRLKEIFLHISDPDDIDWRYHFSDIGLSEPPTVYMHRDSSMFWTKCLLYLNNVEEKTGPFSYVRGSNQWINPWEYIVSKTNDKARLDQCDPETRKLFSALPKIFQRKAEFGNDLLEKMPETKALLEREIKFTSDKGNFFFFDTDGVHRGGMTVSGSRYMLQIKLE